MSRSLDAGLSRNNGEADATVGRLRGRSNVVNGPKLFGAAGFVVCIKEQREIWGLAVWRFAKTAAVFESEVVPRFCRCMVRLGKVGTIR